MNSNEIESNVKQIFKNFSKAEFLHQLWRSQKSELDCLTACKNFQHFLFEAV